MKLLIISLLLSLQSLGQHYYVIQSANPITKAMNISKRFYQLSRPLAFDTTKYLMAYIKHPTNDSIALIIDSTFDLPKGNITATQITNWINETYPTITTTQRNTLTNYINNNNLLRIGRLILTARIKLWTKQEMILRGWFNSQL